MQKIIILLALIIFLSGCATYKFHQGKAPYDKGYVVSRDDYTILEYTLGKDNSVPALDLAKGRFLRRNKTVEDCYKKMGRIENNFKKYFWNYCAMFLEAIGGVFRLPFIAISDYKYSHNPKYRENMDKLEKEKELAEESRIKKLREELNSYIQEDLAKEASLGVKNR